ncbi:MAG: CDP-diacylglycerol--serine O-phosphatidyltransferase [Proteiniphilum sp.]|nr:CDP-diacylglycerol--serine O-phosphatidyltransferase [Proteiniphilum sp.]
MRKQIPNILTLLNLFSGCIAITMAFQENFTAVAIWVAVAALFDFWDGMAARILKAYSAIGKELDSLADVVSFGVAPASAVFILLRDHSLFPGYLDTGSLFIPYLAFLIPVFSALRLARFNIDDRETTTFMGLPTPANGLFWVSYCCGLHVLTSEKEYLFYITAGAIFLMSLLMVSGIPMFSLKIKQIRLKGNERQLLLILLMIAFIAIWGIIGVAFGIVSYIVLSIVLSSKFSASESEE